MRESAWRLRTFFAVIAAMCAATVVGAQVADPELVQRLMAEAGISSQLEQFPRSVQLGIAQWNQQAGSLGPKEVEDLDATVAEVFAPAKLNDSAAEYLQANLSNDDIRAALAWLESPLGLRITKLESDGSTPEALQQIPTMAEELLSDVTRVALVQQVDAVARVSEFAVAITLDSQVAMIAALMAIVPEEQRLSVEEIRSQVIEGSGQLRALLEQQTLLLLVYCYRSLTDAEISSYIAFYESKPGARTCAAVNQCLGSAIGEASKAMAERIVGL